MAVKVIQTILSGFLCIIIMRMGRLLFNHRVGLISAFLLAINPELIALSGYLYTETLYIFLCCLAFFFLVKGLKNRDGIRYWILSGLFLGFSILTRHVLLLFPVFLFFICLLFRKTRFFWKKILIYSGVCYLVVAPWIIRNYVVFEEFIPVASGAGGGLFMGSYLKDEGGYQYKKSVKLLIDESKGAKSFADRDSILMRKAWRNIMDHPWAYTKIVLKKMGNFFFQIYQNRPRGGERRFDLKTTLFMAFSYYPILLLFLIGLYLSRDKWTTLLPFYAVIAYSSLLYSVMIFIPRYRIPLIPFFVLVSGFAIHWIWEYKLRFLLHAFKKR